MNDESVFGAEGEWCLLELFGRKRVVGLVTQVAIAGSDFLRVDVPTEPPATAFYGGSAIYGISPLTEELARAWVAANAGPQPISRYELPRPVDHPLHNPEIDGQGDRDDNDDEDNPF